ncbi:MAG: hypothetical protein AB1758_14390 [Candidatus Eremiobacterota bacterium]
MLISDNPSPGPVYRPRSTRVEPGPVPAPASPPAAGVITLSPQGSKALVDQAYQRMDSAVAEGVNDPAAGPVVKDVLRAAIEQTRSQAAQSGGRFDKDSALTLNLAEAAARTLDGLDEKSPAYAALSRIFEASADYLEARLMARKGGN